MAPVKVKNKIAEEEKPISSINETSILSSYNENVIAGIRACVALNESILLVGETGTGKTTLINELAKESSKKLHRVSVNGSMGVDEILGKWLAKDGSTYWIDGILTKAVREGHWVIFDEMNAMLPEMGFALHSLLDDAKTITLAEKDGEVIPAHEDFRFFGSINPGDDYAGTKEINMALMSRFGGVFIIDVFSIEKEKEVLKRHGAEDEAIIELVNFANHLREMRKKGDIYTFVSTRDIIQASKMTKAGLDISLAIQYAVLNKMTEEEREDLKKTKSIEDLLKTAYETKEQRDAKTAIANALETRDNALSQLKDEQEKNKRLEESLDNLNAQKKIGGLHGIDPKKAALLKALGVEVTE